MWVWLGKGRPVQVGPADQPALQQAWTGFLLGLTSPPAGPHRWPGPEDLPAKAPARPRKHCLNMRALIRPRCAMPEMLAGPSP